MIRSPAFIVTPRSSRSFLRIRPEKVTEKASFIDDLGADSLDNVELVMALEEEFDIEIPDDEAEKVKTVADAVKCIQTRLGEAA